MSNPENGPTSTITVVERAKNDTQFSDAHKIASCFTLAQPQKSQLTLDQARTSPGV